MNLHEYQAKQLFREYQLPTSDGAVASDVDTAVAIMKNLNTPEVVVKAQVHAGGRGKAGGVKLVKDEQALRDVFDRLIGKNLVTYQTDSRGQPVNQILIEKASDIARELYLGAVVDRATRRVIFMASTEGGVEIEEVAAKHPEKILKVVMDPVVGIQPYQCRDVAFKLGLNDEQIKQFTHIMINLGRLFVEKDFALLEINPLIVKTDGHLSCLDGKIVVDGNALYRQPVVRAMYDASQEDERENRAREWELNYVALEGDIGCMVNGAGLAMATMDLVKFHGGQPANFLDVGGGATKERVTEAFKIILSDKNVKAILVNIFGGIVRCDLIADGILAAVKEVGLTLPVIVRLEGNNADLGAKLLNDSGMNIIAAKSFDDAAIQVVAAAKKS
ncbi:MAG: ADP-forming succinate--CoA ligase subunit beta [Gammaproteobacteria bacterium]|nr:ADP-forming succinate--CoA ligase subunit beta [Gammaproteobacteria bacterium]MCD8542371.1 ADP-forming succinate--CoA ligase subunit beta [Gammaproteobacteria bacterium]MCD8573698.1 ADP-forming succinate--CoA ligase subunit beta [Gammaproteobacteria bacterium]